MRKVSIAAVTILVCTSADINVMWLRWIGFVLTHLHLAFRYPFCNSITSGPRSVVGIATDYGLDGPGIESWWGEIFHTCPDRPWGPPSLLYNGYRVFPGGKERPGRDADPSPPSSVAGHERVELYLYSSYGPYDLSRRSAAGRSPAEIVGSNPTGAWIFVCCECRVLSGRGLCDELITRPEEPYGLCCIVVCDLETSRIGAPCTYIYIYIYDISSLRVNYLTLILLPWRKWWANNGSK